MQEFALRKNTQKVSTSFGNENNRLVKSMEYAMKITGFAFSSVERYYEIVKKSM